MDKFGELYVKPGIFPRELGRRLNEALKVQSWARYKHHMVITEEMARSNLSLASEMIENLKNTLASVKHE